MTLPVLTVALDGPTLRGGRVFIDGHDISGGVMELTIALGTDDVTRAELVLAVGALEIDAPTLAILQANVKVTESVPDPEPDPAMRAFGQEPAHA